MGYGKYSDMESMTIRTSLLAVLVLVGTLPGQAEAVVIYDFQGVCNRTCTGYVTGELQLTDEYQIGSWADADSFVSWTFTASNLRSPGTYPNNPYPYTYTVSPEELGTFHFLHGINSDGAEAYSLRIESMAYERPEFTLSGWVDQYPDFESWELRRYPPTSIFTRTHSGYWSVPLSATAHYAEELFFRRRPDIGVPEPGTFALLGLGLAGLGLSRRRKTAWAICHRDRKSKAQGSDMKSKVLGLLAVGLLAGSMPARAAMITELFQVTLPYASGLYAAGHVFDITVTYDDAGIVLHHWNDGPNGVGEFGKGDDTLAATHYLDGAAYGATMWSDAQISISGLAALPAGSTPRDVFTVNSSIVTYQFFTEDVSNVSVPYSAVGISYAKDDIVLSLALGTNGDEAFAYYYLRQYFLTAESAPDSYQPDSYELEMNDPAFITRQTVPEPGTFALLGLGLLGLGVTRRRQYE